MQRVVALYETLVPADLPALRGVYADDARFKDPFNAVQGVPAIARIFGHMFATLGEPVTYTLTIKNSGTATGSGTRWSACTWPTSRRCARCCGRPA